MDRKGFFFIIVAFVLLSYILASTYVWVRAIEMEEARYSEAFRVSSMEMLLSQVTEGRIEGFTNISGHYALYRLNHHSIFHPVKPSEDIPSGGELDGSELGNIRRAMRELILYGTASGDYFDDGEGIEYTMGEKLIYSLEGWKTQLNSSLRASGFVLSKLDIDESTFAFNQTDYMKFNVSFIMGLEIRDNRSGSATSLSRDYNISVEMDEEGMVDAYIARESDRQMDISDPDYPEYTIVGKRIFLTPYWDEGYESLCSGHDSEPYCYYVDSGSEGQGWFYGPVVMAGDAGEVDPASTYNYILAGDYSAVTGVSNWRDFGAYILTSPPEPGPDCGGNQQFDTLNALEYDDDCEEASINRAYETTEKPFMVYTGFDIDDFGGDRASPHKLLFIAKHSFAEVEENPELKVRDENGRAEVAVYDIEGLRDFVMCGYYIPRPESPSFLHRMFDIQGMFDDLNPAYHRWPNSDWGIETTAAGRWAGGDLVPSEWDTHSRLDTEFFSDPNDVLYEVHIIKGMFGCKNAIMCGMPFVGVDNVGHFYFGYWPRWERPSSGETPSDEIYYIDTEDPEDAETDNIGCDNNEHASCEEK